MQTTCCTARTRDKKPATLERVRAPRTLVMTFPPKLNPDRKRELLGCLLGESTKNK